MAFLFCVILTFSLPLAISANVLDGKECDVSHGEIYITGTKVADYAACKQACLDNAKCQSVTFYNHGGCGLFATKCEATKASANARSELVKELGGLHGKECDSSNGEIWLTGSTVADFAACKKACEDDAQCQSITFYHHGGCSLFATKCEKTKASAGATSAVVEKTLEGKVGQECDVSQGEIWLADSEQPDFAACKQACEDYTACHSITFYYGGLSCNLFGTTCEKTKANVGAHAAKVKEVQAPPPEQCEIDGTCTVNRGEECDRAQGESYLVDGSDHLSYEECKDACADRIQCQSITYFSHGWCSLFSTQCTKRKPFENARSVTLKADYFNHQECDTGAGEVLLSASSGNQPDLATCQKSCEDEPKCRSTTFFKSGYCSHFSTCCEKRKPSPTGKADAVKTAQCVDACVVENGGCDAKRSCTSKLGVATCGDCSSPLINDGAKGCKYPDACKANNGGCDSKRACTSTGGVASCGACSAGFINDGPKGCKAKPKPKPVPAPSVGFIRAPTFDGKKCPFNHPDRLFKQKNKTPTECAALCKKNAQCKYFTTENETRGWCIACKVAPSEKHPGAISYVMTRAVEFDRAPTFDGKKCPLNHPDRLFKQKNKTPSECAAMCKKNAQCKYFTTENETRGWCIGCKVAPSEKHPGAISYVMRRKGGGSSKPTPPKKPSELEFPYPSNYPAASCAKMKPKCNGISAAACKKPCDLTGAHSCCSYRPGCHSCCSGGYLNDKCCPPGHGKCIAPPEKAVIPAGFPAASCAKIVPTCKHINQEQCNKPCPLNGSNSCCSYRIGCHSCCKDGYLNDKCCPPNFGKCVKPPEKAVIPAGYPAASCAKIVPTCKHISQAQCNKPCNLKGSHSCCSYRPGCHSCCKDGYLNDKCCPPGHGKCVAPPKKAVIPAGFPAATCAKLAPKCKHITEAQCNKPCNLKGSHGCCSYRIGCHSCCSGGYLNAKCCPPGHGQCIEPARKNCAKMKPKCTHITEAQCKKPCPLNGSHSCCSYRPGCHSCCKDGYLNDKCCPPGHGKCPASLPPLASFI